jgi:hypothetical protein
MLSSVAACEASGRGVILLTKSRFFKKTYRNRFLRPVNYSLRVSYSERIERRIRIKIDPNARNDKPIMI